MSEPPTSAEILKKAYDIAKEKLDYVYIGNIYISGTDDTRCPKCDNLLIKRAGFSTQLVGLTKDDKCEKCGKKIRGIFKSSRRQEFKKTRSRTTFQGRLNKSSRIKR